MRLKVFHWIIGFLEDHFPDELREYIVDSRSDPNFGGIW